MITEIRYFLVAGAVLAASVASAYAQSPADDFTRRQEEQSQTRRLDALRRATPGGGAEAENGPLPGGERNGACFDITRVEIDGASRLSREQLGKVTAPYGNRCVGLAEINAVLKDVTHLYIDHGYVTSRAYVPQQDIRKTRILRLLVVEGTLSDIYLNGKKVAGNGSLVTAFPGLIGRVVNIRDIEQGLDQMNRLQANDAKSAMLPGPKDGTSILNIENHPGRPWHVSLGNNNLGQESTGFSRSSASLGFDDLLDVNDQWNFSYEHSGPNYPWSNDGRGYSNSYSGSVSVPYGYSTFSLNGMATPYVDLKDNDDVYFVVEERGVELERMKCPSIDDLLYRLFSSITFGMASHYAGANGKFGMDFRRAMFQEQLRLLAIASSDWKARKELEIKEILRKTPYDDGLVSASWGSQSWAYHWTAPE
jgi:hemolysin activation/secretion protein